MATFQDQLTKMTAVKQVIFVDRGAAWEDFKKNYPKMAIGDLLHENPLPDSFRILLSNNEHVLTLSNYLRQFGTYVDDVVYGGILAERVERFSRFVKVGGLALVVLFAFATLMIVVNTIRLTVIARQEEITIMRLVGATNSFIKGPFIFEGLFMGILGSALSVLILKISYTFLAIKFQERIPYFPMVFDSFLLTMVYLGVGCLGAGLGVLGAYLSVSRSLKTTT